MASATVPLCAPSSVGRQMGENYKIYPAPLRIISSHWMVAAPYAPHQKPDSSVASTSSGFELSKHSPTSNSVPGQYTPASDSASDVSQLDNLPLQTPSQHCYAALETRIERLLEENELLAQERRDLHHQRNEKKKQKKERKNKGRKARLHKHIMLEVLRVVTAALRPMPEGSPARFVYMVVEGFFLWERDVES